MILQPCSNESFQHSPQHLQSSPKTCPSVQREAGGGAGQDAHQPPKCFYCPRQDPLPAATSTQPQRSAPLAKSPKKSSLSSPGHPQAGVGPAMPTQVSLLGSGGCWASSPPWQQLGFATGTGLLSAASAAATTTAPATFLAWAGVLPRLGAAPRAASHGKDDYTPLLAAQLRRRWAQREAAGAACRGPHSPLPWGRAPPHLSPMPAARLGGAGCSSLSPAKQAWAPHLLIWDPS